MAYEFGAIFWDPIRRKGRSARPSHRSVEHGIQIIPTTGSFYELALIYYYMESKNYARHAESFERGTKCRMRTRLRILAAQMAQPAGESRPRACCAGCLCHYAGSTVRINATEHLRALQVDEDVTHWRRSSLHTRKNWTAPIDHQHIDCPACCADCQSTPMEKPYKLMPDGRIELSNLA